MIKKLDCVDTINYLLSFDIFTLTETFVEYDFHSELFKDFIIFNAKAKKLSHHGRCSGGVRFKARVYFKSILVLFIH